jgi:hypothetical protein
LAIGRVKVVVKHVDSATKCKIGINDTQLPMQSAPTQRDQQAPLSKRREKVPLDTGSVEPLRPLLRHRRSADPIHDQENGNAPNGSPFQCGRYPFTGCIETEDICLQPHFVHAGINGTHQRSKKICTALE